MSEVNPNNPMTQAMRDEWSKIAALLMHKLGESDVTLTVEDLETAPPLFIAVQGVEGGLRVRLLDEEEARELAKRSGGLPA